MVSVRREDKAVYLHRHYLVCRSRHHLEGIVSPFDHTTCCIRNDSSVHAGRDVYCPIRDSIVFRLHLIGSDQVSGNGQPFRRTITLSHHTDHIVGSHLRSGRHHTIEIGIKTRHQLYRLQRQPLAFIQQCLHATIGSKKRHGNLSGEGFVGYVLQSTGTYAELRASLNVSHVRRHTNLVLICREMHRRPVCACSSRLNVVYDRSLVIETMRCAHRRIECIRREIAVGSTTPSPIDMEVGNGTSHLISIAHESMSRRNILPAVDDRTSRLYFIYDNGIPHFTIGLRTFLVRYSRIISEE